MRETRISDALFRHLVKKIALLFLICMPSAGIRDVLIVVSMEEEKQVLMKRATIYSH